MPPKRKFTKSNNNNDSEGNVDGPKFDLGKHKKVTVRSFKGNTLVDIREFYQPSGQETELPGKKGISLSMDVWKALITQLPEIKKAVAQFEGTGDVEEDEAPARKETKIEKNEDEKAEKLPVENEEEERVEDKEEDSVSEEE